jgi:primosomal protein N' (replication factor Y) (superfamily II helicase)
LRSAGAGIVLGQRKGKGFRLVFPVLQSALQIPGSGFKIRSGIVKLIRPEVIDPVFSRPFGGCLFAHLHEAALACVAALCRIEPAFTPHHRLYQHRVETVLDRYGPDQFVVLSKARRADPFVKRVNWIARAHRDKDESRHDGQQNAKDQLEQKPDHVSINQRIVPDGSIKNRLKGMMRPSFVRVVLDRAIHRELDYAVPESLSDRIGVGSRVRVPFRDKSALGTVVVALEQSDAKGIRPVQALVGEAPTLSEQLLELARWMSAYYCCPIETVMRSLLPQVIRRAEIGWKKQLFVRPARAIENEELEKLRKRAPRQAELLEAIRGLNAPVQAADLLRKTSLDNQTLRALAKRGLVDLREEAVERDPHGDEQFIATANLELNPEQALALKQILAALDSLQNARPILLHGVTGSGKTEIYLQAIRAALDRGQSAIVLVPEISLTPQTVERFKGRFAPAAGGPDVVAVLHSHLSEGERHDEWHKIHSGRARIVIGARSAVFAPLKKLGLIIVDEEHETTYKQEDAPRYHARDVAVMRAKIEKCAIVLGSATPSLESYHNASTGKYHLATLTQRVDERQMPLMRIVDLRQERRKQKRAAILSEKLSQAIADRLEKGQQTILFLNRRGFSTSLLCSECGAARDCPNCSVALTFHRHIARLSCHLCGHTAAVPKRCPACGKDALIYVGFGTEKVESTVSHLFPKANVRRMDADSMTRKEAYRETLRSFRAGKIDILVGTQMIAKGLHFPNVTLVGIINADLALHLPDFRAGERTFQLLTQVAGRAGRGEQPGEVFVQTYTPFSPSIQFARHHDFAGYFQQELEFRERCDFPPFKHAILVTVRSAHEERARFSAVTLARRLREAVGPEFILGDATPAPLEKLQGQFRFHILLRGSAIMRLSRLVRETLEKLPFPEDVTVTVDVDPYQLL